MVSTPTVPVQGSYVWRGILRIRGWDVFNSRRTGLSMTYPGCKSVLLPRLDSFAWILDRLPGFRAYFEERQQITIRGKLVPLSPKGPRSYMVYYILGLPKKGIWEPLWAEVYTICIHGSFP